jgi:two-component system, LytTR family, sensor kinase
LEADRVLKGEQVFNRNLIIGILFFFMMMLVVVGIVMIRNIRSKRRTDKLLALQSLSGQMNPHFIFNALNSVNEFIAQNDERSANRYLSSFSKLMRQVMDDSRHTFIPLPDELEMLKLYLQLEQDRFKEQFDYSLEISEGLIPAEFEIPPMMIQPYIENAIGHGLRYKKERGILLIKLELKDQLLCISIVDDGIGLQKSKELKTLHQKKQVSLAMKNIETRVTLINEIYDAGIRIEIAEAYPGKEFPGTAVTISVPQKITGYMN